MFGAVHFKIYTHSISYTKTINYQCCFFLDLLRMNFKLQINSILQLGTAKEKPSMLFSFLADG